MKSARPLLLLTFCSRERLPNDCRGVGSRRQQEDFVHALEVTGLQPVIDRSFGLDRLTEAFRYEEAGAHFGKICVEF